MIPLFGRQDRSKDIECKSALPDFAPRSQLLAGCSRAFPFLVGLFWGVLPVSAQVASAGAAEPESSEVVTLNPFIVSSEGDESYTATDTLAGNRVRTKLADIGSSVQVITQKFLQDTKSNNAAGLLVYTTSTEVSGPGGNFLGQGNGAILTNQTGNLPVTRIRGLAEADLTQDFFLTRIPFDIYNTGRVDIQRGPNAILFGIGSAGGIVNGTTNGALFQNKIALENQVDNYGSIRTTLDLNRELLPDELAIRVAALQDNTKYRQEPTFRDDHRISGMLKWDPAVLNRGSAHTSFTVNAEKGKIDGNAPINTPPIDNISPYFNDPLFRGADGKPRLYTAAEVAAASTTNYWLTATPNFRNVFNVTAFEASGAQGVSYYGLPFAWPDTTGVNAPGGIPQGYRIFGITSVGVKPGAVGSQLGAFKASSLTDPSIFDFYNNSLAGPNNHASDDFDRVTATLSQTFLNNRLGFSLAYNRQNVESFNDSLLGGGAFAIGVDLMSQLPSGDPNPNAGRPGIIGSSGTGTWTDETRDTLRFSAFAEYDFKDHLGRESRLARILGRHVFTGLIDRYSISADNRSYLTHIISPDPANWQSANPTNLETSAREDSFIYLGNSVAGRTTAAGLDLTRLTGVIQYAPTTQVLWNNVTNSWVNAPLNVYDNSALPIGSRRFLSASLAKDEIRSQAITWQGYLFEGTLVPSIGYRTDTNDSYLTQAGTLAGTGWADTQSPLYRLGDSASSQVKGHSTTYSLVAHLPERYREKIPGKIGVSPFFNQSSNFRPSAGRIDVMGNPLPSPQGKTREYGVTLRALDDKVTLKITHFKTTVENATVPGLESPMIAAIIAYGWGQSSYHAWTNPVGSVPLGFLQTVYGTTSSGQPLFLQPAGYPPSSPGPYPQGVIDATYQIQQAAITAWAKAYEQGGAQLPRGIQDTFALADYSNPSLYASAFSPNPNAVVTGSTEAEGMEYELSGNPLPGLLLSVSVSHTKSTLSGIGATFVDFFAKTQQLFNGPAGQMTLFGSNDWNAFKYFQQIALPQYNVVVAASGTQVPELRPWNGVGTIDYTFQHGMLKGAHFGGSYRWAGKEIIGYPVLLQDGLESYDIPRPYYGKSIDTVDAWIGYKRPLSKRVVWTVQLNVRNLFASKELIPVTVQPDGSPAGYRIPEPRVISLSNKFEF